MNVRSVVFVAVALLVGFAVMKGLPFSFYKTPPPLLPVTIVQLQVPHSGLLHIAEAKNYFADEGLAVTVKSVLTGREAVTLVLNGEADFGSTAETPVALALAEGKQPHIIASIFSSRWSSGIVVRKDHGVKAPLDLKGKRIGYVFGTNTHYDLETFLAFHDIPLTEITLVASRPDELVTALVAGTIDAASIWIPFMTQMQQKLGDKVDTFYPQEGYAQTFNLMVRPDYVARNRAEVDRVLRALRTAELFAEKHPDEAQAIVAAASGIDASVLGGHGDPLIYELTLRQSLLMSTENEVRWYFRRGLVPHRDFPDVLQAMETEPLRALKPTDVTIAK